MTALSECLTAPRSHPTIYFSQCRFIALPYGHAVDPGEPEPVKLLGRARACGGRVVRFSNLFDKLRVGGGRGGG